MIVATIQRSTAYPNDGSEGRDSKINTGTGGRNKSLVIPSIILNVFVWSFNTPIYLKKEKTTTIQVYCFTD